MLFVVAAALVDIDGRVLLAQRPAGKAMAGLWEFPGGKVHADETPEDALARELKEELGIRTCRLCFTPAAFVTHPLNAANGQPDVDPSPYPSPRRVRHSLGDGGRGEGSPTTSRSGGAGEGMERGCDPNLVLDPDDPAALLLMLLYLCRRWVGTLQSHEGQALKWVYPKDMHALAMPPADKPLVHRLMEIL